MPKRLDSSRSGSACADDHDRLRWSGDRLRLLRVRDYIPDEDATVTLLDGVSRHRAERGSPLRMAGANVECRVVEGTEHEVTIEQPGAEGRAVVGAPGADGKDPVCRTSDDYRLLADMAKGHLALGEI